MSFIKITTTLININNINHIDIDCDELKVEIIMNNSLTKVFWTFDTQKDTKSFYHDLFILLNNPEKYNYNFEEVKYKKT